MLWRTGAIFRGMALVVLTVHAAAGADFRLSFLDEQMVLDDTGQLLKENGFSEDSVRIFKKLVGDHNRPGNRVDRAKFPPLQKAYYHFVSFADFTNRVAGGFSETPGNSSFPQTTLMCFDVVSLLLGGVGCAAPQLEDGLTSKGFVSVEPDGSLVPVVPEKFRAAIGVMSPANGYEAMVGRPRSEAETQIGLSLRAKRRLPPGFANSDADLRSVFFAHISDVKKDGFKFPTNCKIGLGLVVNAKRNYVWGDHSFICIQKNRRFICLEKNGSKGPYVRAEFKSEKDLAQYMSWDLLLDVANPETTNFGSSVLISLNERLIGIFRPRVP